MESVPAGGQLDGIWGLLRERIEYATFVPTLVAGVERADLRRRDGSDEARQHQRQQ